MPRTIFDDPDPAAPPDHRHFYDQVTWFVDTPGVPALTLQYENAGRFNFADGLIPATNPLQLSWPISDHFPLWVEFRSHPDRPVASRSTRAPATTSHIAQPWF